MHTEFDFSDADWMSYLKSIDIPDLNDWMRSQAARGQEYYRNRIRRLGVAGGRVLDAGCGVGNWAIALACFFEEVVAVENDGVRLGVVEGMRSHFGGRIKTQLASIDELPFEDASFDFVFCNGVIFVTEYEKVLEEFARVLKPGGCVYLTYNGKGWWRYLIHDRGRTDPVCIRYGANGLIARYFMLMDKIAFEQRASDESRRLFQHALLERFPANGLSWPYARRLHEAYSAYLGSEDDRSNSLEEMLIAWLRKTFVESGGSARERRLAADAKLCLDELCGPTVPAEYKVRIGRDLLSRLALGRSDYMHEIYTYAHEPEEMTDELVRKGFHAVESAHEGCLCLDPEAPHVRPIHPASVDVFESLARR